MATQNYNLTIPVGADIVNLLTQCYPNFETLDTVVKEVSDAGITVATESKTGTVHNLIRTNSDRAVLRFTATSNWESGDSFTVDGLAVTTVTPSGEALQTGAFVINSNVIGILVGTVLTIFAGGIPSTVNNALNLDGHPASYYGTSADVTALTNKVSTVITGILAVNTQSVTIYDQSITVNSLIDYWQEVGTTSTELIAPSEVTVVNGSVTLTFPETYDHNITVGVRVI